MVGKLIIRGLIVGLIAGLIAFGFAKVYGEPSVDAAIAFEDLMTAQEAAGQPPAPEEPELVNRATQSTIGLMTGIVIVGVVMGALFSVLFALANGRFGRLGPVPTSMILATMCYVAIVLVPWLKYPASPPASTFDDTIAFRTSVYFLMLAISIAAMVGAWILRRRFVASYGNFNGTMLAVAAYLVVIGIFFLVMPTINETPANFPATAMWDFRVASIGIQTVLWASIGVIFGYVVERTMVAAGAAPRRVAAAR